MYRIALSVLRDELHNAASIPKLSMEQWNCLSISFLYSCGVRDVHSWLHDSLGLFELPLLRWSIRAMAHIWGSNKDELACSPKLEFLWIGQTPGLHVRILSTHQQSSYLWWPDSAEGIQLLVSFSARGSIYDQETSISSLTDEQKCHCSFVEFSILCWWWHFLTVT